MKNMAILFFFLACDWIDISFAMDVGSVTSQGFGPCDSQKWCLQNKLPMKVIIFQNIMLMTCIKIF